MSNQGMADCHVPLVRRPLAVDELPELAAAFKAIGDPVRLRMLSMIAAQAGGEVCVCELNEGFELSGPTISHHLKVLRQAGLVVGERRGTWVYYRVVPSRLRRLSESLAGSADSVEAAA